MIQLPVIEIDIHGYKTLEAIKEIKKKVDAARGDVYKVRVIHGYHGGIKLREAIREEFGYGR